MKNAISKFFSDLLSIDESKKSVVVIVFIAFSIIVCEKFLIKGLDIPPNLMTLLITMSCLIFGANSINNVSNVIMASRSNNQSSMYSSGSYGSMSYGSSYNNYSTTPTTATTPIINSTTPTTNNSTINPV